jgi:hypothetical protein
MKRTRSYHSADDEAQIASVPDVCIAIRFDARNYGVYFVEIDRTTMSTSRWQEKIPVYREYNHSQHLRDEFKVEWCIVLTVALLAIY